MIETFVVFGLTIAAVAVLARSQTLDDLLSALDISDNVQRVVDWVSGVRGPAATVTAICTGAVTIAMAAMSWRFDLLPSWQFMQVLVEYFALAGVAADVLLIVGLVLTLLPTLIELATTGLARRDVKLLSILVWTMVVFDLATDYPVAAELVGNWRAAGLFGDLPNWLAGVGSNLLKLGWTFLASFGFELLTICFGVATLLLLVNAGRQERRGKVQ